MTSKCKRYDKIPSSSYNYSSIHFICRVPYRLIPDRRTNILNTSSHFPVLSIILSNFYGSLLPLSN